MCAVTLSCNIPALCVCLSARPCAGGAFGGKDGQGGGQAGSADGGWTRRHSDEDLSGVYQECPRKATGVYVCNKRWHQDILLCFLSHFECLGGYSTGFFADRKDPFLSLCPCVLSTVHFSYSPVFLCDVIELFINGSCAGGGGSFHFFNIHEIPFSFHSLN